ncbi:hypothetical protein [Nocardia cyriacigeorgica]|uniref:hypothetical protein n=1 Tax=Nocardia cyriacigeorgica TaxID=135487 RepID=UPI0024577148|nr:hypothetical protein [Nocardia cyriacigeorgica]
MTITEATRVVEGSLTSDKWKPVGVGTSGAPFGLLTLSSFAGDAFPALIDLEPDGALSILTEDRKGCGSAHIAAAYNHFGGPAMKELEHRYTSATGYPRVLTVWREL